MDVKREKTTFAILMMRVTLLALTLSAGCLLLALLAGHLLPSGETLLLTLPSRFSMGLYLFDLEHRFLYRINENAAGQYVLNPADTDWIAYSANPGGDWEIYLMNLFSGETRRITSGTGFNQQPAWSADGRWIAFVSNRSGATNIYGVPVSGGAAPKTLSRGVVLKNEPSWSPDGKRLVFEARDSNGTNSLYVTEVSCLAENVACPQTVKQLTFSSRGDYVPTWSPDGRWVAFLSDRGGRTDLYIVDTACLDTSAGCVVQNARQLTHNIRATGNLSWSRDGQHLFFVAEYTNHPTLYTIPLGCDLLPEGCVPEALLTVKR